MFLCPSNMFLYCPGSDICTVNVLVPVLFLFWYPHCRASDTPSHLIPEGSTVNRYLHSHPVPTLHVIWYPHSMSSSTNSSGTNTEIIRYSKSSDNRSFYSQPVPAHSSGTHTPCHLVPTLHVIQYSARPVPILRSFSTRMFYSQMVPAQSFGTHTPCHMVPTLHFIQYSARPVPILRSSSTPSHPVPEGSTVNRYMHSHLVPILHVIWYQHSMSSSTQLVRYQFCTRPVPMVCSSGTNINSHVLEII
jgi:hypothetical protein